MSKTKNKDIDTLQEKSVITILQAESSVTDKAAVVEGWFFKGTATPPAVYVQGDNRLVVVAPTADAANELCGAVSEALANDYTTMSSACYGCEEMGEVWYIIEVNDKK